MRIYSTKKMLALNRKVCDIDTRRDVFLTPAGWAVRTISKTMELMKLFGFTGKEMTHIRQSLKAMEQKKKALVVSDQGEQYAEWHLSYRR